MDISNESSHNPYLKILGYQKQTFSKSVSNDYSSKEKELLTTSLNLELTKETLKEKHIKFYLDIYKKVRKVTLKEFKKRNDDWWTKFYHNAWFHVMEHQAHHMGQIKLISNRFPE